MVFECVAENGVGDPVSAKAKLEVLDGERMITTIRHCIWGIFWYMTYNIFWFKQLVIVP